MRALRLSLLLGLALAPLGGCRDYQFAKHVSDQGGLIPADQFARYGREQAIAVAVGREFARPYNSGSETQADVAMNYARNKFASDITEISADGQSNRIVITFKSGWRTAVVPIKDGKTGDDTKVPS
ncbi:MAG TPA: hypothetical protein VG692_12010 [Gemmatimonadales bacterium]|nr:hypothetical protein [Gemmatimonadales bacterium]